MKEAIPQIKQYLEGVDAPVTASMAWSAENMRSSSMR